MAFTSMFLAGSVGGTGMRLGINLDEAVGGGIVKVAAGSMKELGGVCDVKQGGRGLGTGSGNRVSLGGRMVVKDEVMSEWERPDKGRRVDRRIARGRVDQWLAGVMEEAD